MGKLSDKKRTGKGTKEWSEHSYNIGAGCLHDCRYCYARQRAIRFGIIKQRTEWPVEKVNARRVSDKHRPVDGVIMFPTIHDITPAYLPTAIKALIGMLSVGNKVLIVSKPHLTSIRELCSVLTPYRDNILFRFTITSLDPNTARFWEPGAPSPQERIMALKAAFHEDFQTSVSMEPYLDDNAGVSELVAEVDPFVTDDIWIGKMNDISRRVNTSDPAVKEAVNIIMQNQADEEVISLYRTLAGYEKVRWKDSIKHVLKSHKALPLR